MSFVGGGDLELGCAGGDDEDRSQVDGRDKDGGGKGIVYLIRDAQPEET